MDLQPQQFFHGTVHAIKDGMVRPADDADVPVSEYSMGDLRGEPEPPPLADHPRLF